MTAPANSRATPAPKFTAAPALLLQRACACGGSAGLTGKCSSCEAEERFGRVQPKLFVGPAGDAYEREADQVADQVMDGARTGGGLPAIRPLVQRQEADAEEDDERDEVQAKVAPGGAAAPRHDFAARMAAAGANGAPLRREAREFLEPRFGRDLSHVRIHDGAAASGLARDINARAFTHGPNVFFADGQHRPDSGPGLRLLAHEITHTFQQGSGQGSIQREEAAKPKPKPSSGGTPGGFFANIGRAIVSIFTDEPEYSDEDLTKYLEDLKARDAIEDDFDSDNKARGVVAKKLNEKENLRVNTLLIEELLSGAAMDGDEQAVLAILNFLSAADRETAAKAISFERLYDKFDGSELDELYILFPVLDSLHPRRGDKSKTRTMQEYIDRWNALNGVSMTDAEKKNLALGCIGITAHEIGTFDAPDLSNCYETFAEAMAAREKKDLFLKANQPDRKTLLFSKRFYTENKPARDKDSGKVDMSTYDYSPRPGPNMTNFDYGLYDDKTGNWWHANHCDSVMLEDPGCGGAMKVFESSLEHYSRPLQDFNRQIFCVAVAIRR